MSGLFRELFDDAAIFPPGNASPCDAVRGHLNHLASPYSNVVGPLVVSDARWDEVSAVLPLGEVIDVALVVTAGPDGVDRAVTRVMTDPSARLRAVEVSPAGAGAATGAGATTGVGATASAGAASAGAATGIGSATRTDARGDTTPPGSPHELVTAALHALAPATAAGVPGVVEVPLTTDAPRALEALAGSGATAKLRTGGVTPEAHPDELILATALVAAVRAGTPIKLTAGLHHATRTTEAGTGFEQHGLLNVALAINEALGGAEPSDVARTLAERDRGTLAAAVNTLPEDRVATLRGLWRSVGTCSIIEPVGELADLGVLEAAQLVGAGAPRGGS